MSDEIENDANLANIESDELMCSGEDGNISSAKLPKVQIKTKKNFFFKKYGSALNTLIPVQPFSQSKDIHPNDAAGLLSVITFSWLTSLIWKTYKKPPTIDEMWKMSEYDETERNYKRLSKLWEEELKLKGPQEASLWKVILRFVRMRLIISTIMILVYSLALFIGSSIVVRSLLSYISEENPVVHVGTYLVAALVCVDIVRASTEALHLAINYRTAVRCRAAVLLLVFKKALKMSPTGSTSIGELITMCSNDGDRIFEVNHYGNLVFLGPVMFLSGLIYACYLLGPIGLVGPVLFIATIPLQGVLIFIHNKYRKKMIVNTQARIVKISEVLSSIKLIKMYSWETSFCGIVNELREKELSRVKIYNYLYSLVFSITYLAPLVAPGVMISLYVLLGNNLTPDIAFTSISIFNAISTGLKFTPVAIKYIADANVAINRLKKFLVADQLTEYVQTEICCSKTVIEFKHACLIWNAHVDNVSNDLTCEEQSSKKLENETVVETSGVDPKGHSPVLQNVNVSIEQGSLICVVGSVGSGKSSLISGIMGQLQLLEGTVAVSGSIAYVAQQAWLMNATIRENIVFGLDFDQQKYDDVISACELTKDLEVFSSGDLTEVGERGINLSGGQKQRISLARALYSDRDIYLLDDPLSAVDAHVGKNIFLEVILARLKNKGKTVVLVTHQLQYLPHCDYVIQVENSTATLIDATDTVNLSEMVTRSSGPDVLDHLDTKACLKPNSLKDDDEIAEMGKLMTDEERGKVVGLSTYCAYMKSSGGVFSRILIALVLILNAGLLLFSNFWLSHWLQQGSGNSSDFKSFENSSLVFHSTITPLPDQSLDNILLNPDFYFYLIVYILSIFMAVIICAIRGYIYICMTTRASRALHRALLDRVLHGTMEFFETTPTGRILNRFQKDMDELDLLLPGVMEHVFLHVIIVLLSIGLIIYIFPSFAYALIVILPLFIIIYILFKPSSREMMRLDILTRSPWFSHMTAAISGLGTIRAYEKCDDFVKKFCFLLDQNGEAFYLFKCVNRWLSIRLDFLTICITVVTTVFVVFDRNSVTPAFAALALTQAISLGALLQLTVRLSTELEARFVCADRINYYIKHTDQESSTSSKKPRAQWPEEGIIEFQSVSMRYREGLPLAIENLSFLTKPHENIGVVGRTGAGKSSLAVAIFRLVELSEGCILIDGVDINELSLQDVRSRLSIIPQDPVLFSGSVRYNLDPFEQYSESEVWSALEQAHMKDTVANLPDKLNHMVAENGNNFSVGERQLICLARALLRKSKVLILDEATAAVDREIEEIVQNVIQREFSHSTMITIAHRLPTVMTCDRVLVLDKGRIVEFDTPSKLAENKNSVFSAMLSSLGSDLPS